MLDHWYTADSIRVSDTLALPIFELYQKILCRKVLASLQDKRKFKQVSINTQLYTCKVTGYLHAVDIRKHKYNSRLQLSI